MTIEVNLKIYFESSSFLGVISKEVVESSAEEKKWVVFAYVHKVGGKSTEMLPLDVQQEVYMNRNARLLPHWFHRYQKKSIVISAVAIPTHFLQEDDVTFDCEGWLLLMRDMDLLGRGGGYELRVMPQPLRYSQEVLSNLQSMINCG